jgi:hypothetical protein
MIFAVVRGSAALLAALAPDSGAGAAPRPVVLTAAPAHVTLVGSAHTTVRVTNSGTKRVRVDVSRAAFALDLRGRPRVVRGGAARSAATWLTFRPKRFALAPHASVSLAVGAKLPRRPEPGDHDALVLLRTRPVERAGVGVRLRVGVVVVVRAPGAVVRRLELRTLRVAGRGRGRALELVVANRGNVTESLDRARAILVPTRRGGRAVVVVASSRDLRPRTPGILEFRLSGRRHGWTTARVVIPAAEGRGVLTRTYRLRL